MILIQFLVKLAPLGIIMFIHQADSQQAHTAKHWIQASFRNIPEKKAVGNKAIDFIQKLSNLINGLRFTQFVTLRASRNSLFGNRTVNTIRTILELLRVIPMAEITESLLFPVPSSQETLVNAKVIGNISILPAVLKQDYNMMMGLYAVILVMDSTSIVPIKFSEPAVKNSLM